MLFSLHIILLTSERETFAHGITHVVLTRYGKVTQFCDLCFVYLSVGVFRGYFSFFTFFSIEWFQRILPLLRPPAIPLRFTILGEIFAYVTIF